MLHATEAKSIADTFQRILDPSDRQMLSDQILDAAQKGKTSADITIPNPSTSRLVAAKRVLERNGYVVTICGPSRSQKPDWVAVKWDHVK